MLRYSEGPSMLRYSEDPQHATLQGHNDCLPPVCGQEPKQLLLSRVRPLKKAAQVIHRSLKLLAGK